MLLLLFALLLPGCSRGEAPSPEEEASGLLFTLDSNGDRNLTLQEISSVYLQLDPDQDGSLTRQEFAEVTTSVLPDLTQDDLHSLYNLYDEDHNGVLDSADYMISFNTGDLNGDGVVTETEFMTYWLPKFREAQTHG